jgi:hypothetical protein
MTVPCRQFGLGIHIDRLQDKAMASVRRLHLPPRDFTKMTVFPRVEDKVNVLERRGPPSAPPTTKQKCHANHILIHVFWDPTAKAPLLLFNAARAP